MNKTSLITGMLLIFSAAPAHSTSLAELFGANTPTLQQRRAQVQGNQQQRQIQSWRQQRFVTAPQPTRLQPYGLNGQMGDYELVSLLYLDFTHGQSYQAMKDRFGFPAYRDGSADYYKIKGSNRLVAVYYDQSGKAIGYQFTE
jgi:hypothetical protein